MQLWTTFLPQKIVWEITTIQQAGKKGTSKWNEHIRIIENSLKLLKDAGISGIRLVIFPAEITTDGKKFDWTSIDTMLDLCRKADMLVDLCIGPFQYPYYPGIYLPSFMRKIVQEMAGNTRSRNKFGMTGVEYLDDIPGFREYGLRFLRLQMERYGKDARIRGFHFANEWPDAQDVEGVNHLKMEISSNFMLDAGHILKKNTTKPISLNTNIDASSKTKIKETFGNILSILKDQGKLGFDIYPSQETWLKVPLQKVQRYLQNYPDAVNWSCKTFAPSEIYFAEVEAQPWGNGKSWYDLITNESNPEKSVIAYSPISLETTWKKHIAKTMCSTISLWGSDFWLSAHQLGLNWPLDAVAKMKQFAK